MHHLFDDKERFIYFIIPNCKDFLKMDMCRYICTFPNKWKKSLFGEERDHIYIQNVISNLKVFKISKFDGEGGIIPPSPSTGI